ncbi:MAG: hypothetical protein IKR28_11300 [Selenomonadaceae bacterium]|nr:hypothetical protein [Selenomonadaceae bacterium]
MKLRGYWKTLCQYLQDPKGRHDAIEAVEALLLIGTTSAVMIALVWYLNH